MARVSDFCFLQKNPGLKTMFFEGVKNPNLK